MITEDRLKHILGVSRKAYEIALDLGHNEKFARKCFMLGYLHDVGYEFSDTGENHGIISMRLVSSLFEEIPLSNVNLQAIANHGKSQILNNSEELKILNMADMMVDSKGNECLPEDRLKDIKNRYGEKSVQYKKACDLAYEIGLTETNLFD